MAHKIILISALIAAANAVAVPIHTYHSPALIKAIPAAPVYKHIEYDAPAHYDFAYSVHDGHTGDIKSQTESRKGDVVHGSYSLIDSDGYQRIVEYTADDHNGFNAIVHRKPTSVKIPVPVAKVLHAAPVIHAAPAFHYAAPLAKVAVAPIAHGASHVSYSGLGASYHY